MASRSLIIGIFVLTILPLAPAVAQTITPTPDGTGTLIEYQGQTYRITGGTQAGANLFHSFQQFGLSAGEIAQFFSQPGIENILGRVTGGDRSLINGLLQVTGSNANLYLMNPAGIIFGPGSSLDIPGSFTATTADRIGFDGGWFNAFGSNDYSTLIGNPNQFSFLNTQPGGIINGGNLTTSGNLSLIGGTVVNTGTIAGDHVTLAAVPGTSLVRLAQPGMLLTVEVEQSQLEAGITALDLPTLLTGSELSLPQNVQQGEVLITNQVQGQTVDLMAVLRVSPLAPELIRTGDGSDHAPTVVLFPEDLTQPWAVNIIDWRADQPYDLLYGGRLGTVSSLILQDQEGITRINSILERVTEPINELNLVAEGNQGNLWLGQTWLNHENIGDYQGAIQQWGESLGTNAALLIYSCFTALGAIGEGFVNTLAELTGVTVAASTNATGSANYGGDWDLEYSTGNIEVINPFTMETLSNWDGRLETFTVLTPTEGDLAAKIAAANLDLGVPHTIRFAPGITSINLTTSLPLISADMTITGEGRTVTLQRESTAPPFRIFSIGSLVNVTLDYLKITGGVGGISNDGSLTLTNSTVSGNIDFAGGGIVSTGPLTLINSTVSGNTANFDGGGVRAFSDLTLINSTVSGNSAQYGAGIVSTGPLTLLNSTITNNNAMIQGGGMNLAGVINNHIIYNSIVANNISQSRPNINAIEGTQNLDIKHTLINDAIGIPIGQIPINGVNGNIIGLDPLLGPLQNNGGPTQTHALLPGSPAINAGNNNLTIVTVDQRGNSRISGGRVDIGAYEFQEPEPILVQPEPVPTKEVLQDCPPYCDEENLTPLLDFESSAENVLTAILDPGVEELENDINQEYADYLGLAEVPTTTLAEAQSDLQRIAQETGTQPALLYLTFVPPGVESTPDLTQSLIASAHLESMPLAQRSRNLQGSSDQLQLVLVTPYEAPVIKRLSVNREEAVAMASQFNRAIARPNSTGYLDPAQQLYQWLIEPVLAELETHDIDHIGIIADTGLRFIPFAALHDGENFLIQNYSIGLMPSLALTERTYQSIKEEPILAMGASEFTNQSPLPAVPLELSFITGQIGSGQQLLNEDFTLARFQEARAQFGYSIVHMGTHGEFNPGSPADSYIELWGDRLTLDRIQELNLDRPPVELLVLSACRTALGNNDAELGFAGFAVQAGVKSVLGSLWHVSDAGTLGLMSAFYQQLQQAPIKAEALRQSQLAMARGEVYLDGTNLVSGTQTVPLTPELAVFGEVDLSHPFYWSAFAMIGSPW